MRPVSRDLQRITRRGKCCRALPQAYSLPEEHTEGYLKSRDVNTIIGKITKDQEEHPGVKRFNDWKEKLEVRCSKDFTYCFISKYVSDVMFHLNVSLGKLRLYVSSCEQTSS